jgi:sigma-E factor negative regulatory protein RseA
MSEKINEQLSAMFDDELDQQEHELLIRRLKLEDDLKSSWSRYQLIGDVMRNNIAALSTTDLRAGISQQIEQEPAVSTLKPKASMNTRMMKPVAGMAIAASVAAMAIIGLQNLGQGESPLTDVPRLAQAPSTAPLQRVSGTRWDMQQPETEMRLNGYLVNHSEYTSNISLQGMINYARIAGYDSTQNK